MQLVIGLVGPIASGKGTLSEYLTSQGFVYFSLSNVVREETAARGLEITRENLQNIGNELRTKFGGSVLVDRLADRIRQADFVVVDGIRNPEEIFALKELFEGKIVALSAQKKQRVERYLERAKTRGEDGASVSAFTKIDQRDLGKGEDSAGQQVQACIDLADFTLKNNDSIQTLHRNCQEMLDSFFFTTHKMSFSQVALSLTFAK